MKNDSNSLSYRNGGHSLNKMRATNGQAHILLNYYEYLTVTIKGQIANACDGDSFKI